MPALDDREFVPAKCCGTCKHCLTIEAYSPDDSLEYPIYLCCVDGVSDEDKAYLNGILSAQAGMLAMYHGERFQEVLMIDPDDYENASPRYVLCVNCCNLYEKEESDGK